MAYLLINFGAVIIPLIFSFHPKLRFDREWKPFLLASSVTAVFFIGWDVLYTNLGIWGFDENYLIGVNIFNLPVEEVMFFFCIPYACVFTWHCLKQLIKKDYLEKSEKLITNSLILILLVIAGYNYSRLYTSVTFTLLAFALIYIKYVIGGWWISRFYFTYLILLIPFFIVNGLLTGSGFDKPIVWYDDSQNLGIRLITIPVEDVFYGMLLILSNVSLFELFKNGKYAK